MAERVANNTKVASAILCVVKALPFQFFNTFNGRRVRILPRSSNLVTRLSGVEKVKEADKIYHIYPSGPELNSRRLYYISGNVAFRSVSASSSNVNSTGALQSSRELNSPGKAGESNAVSPALTTTTSNREVFEEGKFS